MTKVNKSTSQLIFDQENTGLRIYWFDDGGENTSYNFNVYFLYVVDYFVKNSNL